MKKQILFLTVGFLILLGKPMQGQLAKAFAEGFIAPPVIGFTGAIVALTDSLYI
jgi:hypothetical protein